MAGKKVVKALLIWLAVGVMAALLLVTQLDMHTSWNGDEKAGDPAPANA
jgi:hypothetical protein